MKLEKRHEKVIDRAYRLYLANERRAYSINEEDVEKILDDGNTIEKFFEHTINDQAEILDKDKKFFGEYVCGKTNPKIYNDIKCQAFEEKAKNNWVLNQVIAKDLTYTGSVNSIETEFRKLFKKGRLYFNPKKVKEEAEDLGTAITGIYESIADITGLDYSKPEKMTNILKREDYFSKCMKWNGALTATLGCTILGLIFCGSFYKLDKGIRNSNISGFFSKLSQEAVKIDQQIESLYPEATEIEMIHKTEITSKKTISDLGELLKNEE